MALVEVGAEQRGCHNEKTRVFAHRVGRDDASYAFYGVFGPRHWQSRVADGGWRTARRGYDDTHVLEQDPRVFV